MVRRTLGAFVDKSRVVSPTAFFREAWAFLATAPPVLHPRHVGNFEPLKRIEMVELESVTSREFIFANGRKARGWVSAPTFLEHKYFSVTVHLDLAERELRIADRVYEWLRESFAFSIVYMGTPSQELMEKHAELHQMLNSGLVEISLHRALEKRHLLDRLDLAV